MKSLFIAFVVASISTVAYSFECESLTTGFRYKVNSSKKQIAIYESNGKLIINEPYTKVKIQYFETSPATKKYSYSNKFGELMEIKVRGNKITGSYDNDENLVCKK